MNVYTRKLKGMRVKRKKTKIRKKLLKKKKKKMKKIILLLLSNYLGAVGVANLLCKCIAKYACRSLLTYTLPEKLEIKGIDKKKKNPRFSIVQTYLFYNYNTPTTVYFSMNACFSTN